MSLRALHAPALAGGNPARIAAAEREMEMLNWCVSWDGDPLGYPVYELLRAVNQGHIALEFQRWRLLWRALRDFGVVHHSYG